MEETWLYTKEVEGVASDVSRSEALEHAQEAAHERAAQVLRERRTSPKPLSLAQALNGRGPEVKPGWAAGDVLCQEATRTLSLQLSAFTCRGAQASCARLERPGFAAQRVYFIIPFIQFPHGSTSSKPFGHRSHMFEDV